LNNRSVDFTNRGETVLAIEPRLGLNTRRAGEGRNTSTGSDQSHEEGANVAKSTLTTWREWSATFKGRKPFVHHPFTDSQLAALDMALRRGVRCIE
jgi:hypothetical protein